MKRFKDILYVMVSDSANDVALNHAVVLANNNQANLTVIQIIDNMPTRIQLHGHSLSTETFREKLVTEQSIKLQTLVSSLDHKIGIKTKTLIGTSFIEIIREVLRNKHDLVVKTAENGALLDRLFGSNDMHLLRKCPCPVWLIKPTSSSKHQRIIAAVDIDDFNQSEELNTREQLNFQILEMASSLALSEFAELHIANAWEEISEGLLRSASIGVQESDILTFIEQERRQHQQNLNELISKIMKNLGANAMEYIKPQTHLLKGIAHTEITLLAKTLRLILWLWGQ